MSFEIENNYSVSDAVVLTVKALEPLVKGDRVEIINGTEVQKSATGSWVVLDPRPVEAGCHCEVREGYFQSSIGGGGAGYAGEAFETISGPDANGVITLTRGDSTTQTININDISLSGASYDDITKILTITTQDEEGNNVSTFPVPLSDLVDADQDNEICYKVVDGALPLYKYSFASGIIPHQGILGEFKYRTLTVGGVESSEQDIFYYDTALQTFLPANYPAIEAAVGAHLTAEGVSFESVEFKLTDLGDGTHTTEIVITSDDNTQPLGANFKAKYNVAFGVEEYSTVLSGPFDNEVFYKRETLDQVDTWYLWDGAVYNVVATPDFTGLTVTIDRCADSLLVSPDSGNAIEKRSNGIYVADDTANPKASIEDDTQVVNLVPLTALTVTASAVSDIRGITIIDSAGVDITSSLEVVYSSLTTVEITSNLSHTGIRVNLRGIA